MTLVGIISTTVATITYCSSFLNKLIIFYTLRGTTSPVKYKVASLVGKSQFDNHFYYEVLLVQLSTQ